MSDPLIPQYGRSTLAELLPSIGAQFGLPGVEDALGLPSAQRYLLVLVDGLGRRQLAEHSWLAPTLAGLAGSTITSGVPSTTATSIASLGTGLNPGRHGIAGYSFWYPPTRSVLQTLRWPAGVDGRDVQPQPTWFERFERAGVRTAAIAPAHFAGSGLTAAALTGPSFLPVTEESDLERRVELALQAVTAGERTLGYFYERQLDHSGHTHGTGSAQWREQLQAVDHLVWLLRQALPGDVGIIVTGDHGMVDVPQDRRLIVEDEPDLFAGVTALAGEGRLRQLMTPEPKPLARRWRDRLGADAWVRERDEAIAEGWFGEASPRLVDRFGDVLIAMANPGAVMTRELPRELSLIGMHGSLTEAELEVPLLFG